MATIHFYEKPGCQNNARQQAMLSDAGHRLIVHDLLREPWTAERLRAFFGARPVAQWFNRAAPRVKSGEVVPERVAAEDALKLMLADPLLIRRPLMEGDGKRIVGFDAPDVAPWLTRTPSKTATDALQTCHQDHAPCPSPEAM